MNIKLKRLLRPLLRAVAKGTTPTFRMKSAARQGLFLIEKPVSLKSKAGRLRREQQRTSSRASHNQETDAIYATVEKRAGGFCECGCGKGFDRSGYALFPELDHWLSGTGRRRQKQAVSNTWMLTRICHRMRQQNHPSIAVWNQRFALHAAKYGYPPLPHIEHAALPAKAGGAP